MGKKEKSYGQKMRNENNAKKERNACKSWIDEDD